MALRLVIAGVGHRGRDWLREVRSSQGCEVVACVDSDKNALRVVSDQFPADRCFTDLEEALERIECDAVIVATSASEHVRPCEIALSRKLAVLVEKPFTLKLCEAVRLVLLAEAQQKPLLVAQNYRYMRSFRTAKRLIDEGVLGEIGLVVCQYYRPPHDMVASLAGLPNNVLWGMGVHHLDALRYVLGKEITSIAADSSKVAWGKLPRGASIRALLLFGDDTRGFYSASYESSGHEFFERGQEFYARFVGERGTLHVFQRWLIWCERGKFPRLVKRGRREVTEEQVLLRQLERAVTHDEPADVSGRDNLKTMAALEACVRSAAEQRWINPQDLLNEN